MKNGSLIRITRLHQIATYEGLMAGYPNKQMNMAIIDNAIKNASHHLTFSYIIKATLVTPEITEYEFPQKKYEEENKTLQQIKKIIQPQIPETYPVLPGFITTVYLNDMDRHAIVVLFTQNLADMKEIKEELKSLDWKEISENYCW